MSTPVRFAVGLDMAKAKFDANMVVIDTAHQATIKSSRSNILNSGAGFNDLLSWFKHNVPKNIPGIFCMEATGIYYEQLAWFLHLEGFKVSVMLPNKSKHYLKSLGYKSKNDKIDAKGLAMMAVQQSLPVWSPLSEQLYELRQLTRHYQQLQESRIAFQNQLHAHVFGRQQNELVADHLQYLISSLEQQLKTTVRAIENCLKKDQALWQKVQYINSVKGLGLISIATVIAETDGFHLFKNLSQLVCYAGYDVVENQSGTHKGKTRISKKDNKRIRRILFMPAFCVVKLQVYPFVELYERVYDRTRTKMKAYTAVQRKLLILIYTLWNKNEAFRYSIPTSSGDDGSVALFP